MRLLRPKYVKAYWFNKAMSLGEQKYVLSKSDNILTTIEPFRFSMAAEFQIDVARIKDHLVVYTNAELLCDQTMILEYQNHKYSVLAVEDRKFLNQSIGCYKGLIKKGVDKKYLDAIEASHGTSQAQ
jgi:uncharacterized protein YlxW (UPF0749 family)